MAQQAVTKAPAAGDCYKSRTFLKPQAKLLPLKTTPVRVDVGPAPNLQRFHINAELLCAHSDFFTAALSYGWKEAEERAVNLPEDNAEIFEIWANHVHGIEIIDNAEQTWGAEDTDCGHEGIDETTEFDIEDALGDKEDSSFHHERCIQINRNISRLIKCYYMGDKLGDFDFMDSVMDYLIQFCKDTHYWPDTCADASHIIKRTTESSPLRRLLVDLIIYSKDARDANRNLPHDIWAEVGKGLVGLQKFPKERNAPYHRDTCSYHHHMTRKTPCYKTKSKAPWMQ